MTTPLLMAGAGLGTVTGLPIGLGQGLLLSVETVPWMIRLFCTVGRVVVLVGWLAGTLSAAAVRATNEASAIP